MGACVRWLPFHVLSLTSVALGRSTRAARHTRAKMIFLRARKTIPQYCSGRPAWTLPTAGRVGRARASSVNHDLLPRPIPVSANASRSLIHSRPCYSAFADCSLPTTVTRGPRHPISTPQRTHALRHALARTFLCCISFRCHRSRSAHDPPRTVNDLSISHPYAFLDFSYTSSTLAESSHSHRARLPAVRSLIPNQVLSFPVFMCRLIGRERMPR
jgi:hypothetical protein